MTKHKSYIPLAYQIRNAIIKSKLTRYQIAKDTGIPQSSLSRFMYNNRGLSLYTIELLLQYLKLEVHLKHNPNLRSPPASQSQIS